jgi:serine/threonine protein kinase
MSMRDPSGVRSFCDRAGTLNSGEQRRATRKSRSTLDLKHVPALSEPTDSAASSELVQAMCDAYVGHGRATRLHWPATFQPGDVVAGRYLVERFIARGGMGEVYAVFDRQTSRRVALKTVLSTEADSPEAGRMLEREGRLAGRVAHPNVCRVFGVGVDDQNPRDVTLFISLELLEGETLHSRLERQALAAGEAQQIARQLLGALAATHRAGVLHRDVKTHNVMVSGGADRLRAVLIDFGLARRMVGGYGVGCSGISGSIGYMAPEQLTEQRLTPRTDIFAFGVILFQVLTGRLPSELHSIACLRGVPAAPELKNFPDAVPVPLRELVIRCTRTDPAERFSSAEELLTALDAAYR